jgi:spore maturation protein CgeB
MSGNLSEGWRRLGCQVEELFYGTHMGKSWGAEGLRENVRINAHLLSTARRLKSENRLDLIFAVIYDDVLSEETAKGLRKLDVPMVNYHVDLVGQWYRVLRTGKYFTRVACAQEDHWRGLKRAGIRPYLLQMAANPPADGNTVGSPTHEFDGLLYLGSPWVYRREVLASLAEEDLPLSVYGHNWHRDQPDPANAQPWRKNLHDLRHYLLPRLREEGKESLEATVRRRLKGAAPPAQFAARLPAGVVRGSYAASDFVPLVRGAAINLGFTHFQGEPGTKAERRQVRLRDFEIPMAGGFYLAQDCAQLRTLFEVGRHVETWDTLPELKEKVRHYLQRPEERRSIAREGQAHGLRQHTWESRFTALLRDLNLPLPARPNAANTSELPSVLSL